MRIAFDAKRAFQNTTGLGHYSRTLISSLAQYHPAHEYYLMAPKVTNLYQPSAANVHVISPEGIGKTFRSMWRSNWVKQDLKAAKIDLYHGLSHEIPVGVQHTGIRSVATMHDLIFERYPQHFGSINVAIYRKKFKYACIHADHVIAISRQTKVDLVDIYKIPEEKIIVCYQSCSPIYNRKVSEEEKKTVRERYRLPKQFLLYVGSIIERKNLLSICKALHEHKERLPLPLVVIGNKSEGGTYFKKVKDYIERHGLQQQVILLSEQPFVTDYPGFKNSNDFPAIYQSAVAMIYPSLFEGFGLPVLEALSSGLPVITSNVSCLPEAGGASACYVNPHSVEELAAAIEKVSADEQLRRQMIEKGLAHAATFSTEQTAAAVMKVYERALMA
ncbi:MAG: glycosyltransferase family 1 protein [Sphingobacteriales bacterium]|nr:MAG: glycosyltransferase family 1 protein [Sphingobacteriales bacterium]